MKLALMTWPEVEAYLECSKGIILPVGSTEQHGPMGLIGTDALCASEIAEAAADMAGAIVAPTIAYTPAPFNTGFPGTVSISAQTFLALVADICDGLSAQGFETVYVLNAHGANLAPLRDLSERFHPCGIHIRSWWDFEPVNTLRRSFYGSWEGLHATPSEVAITQARFRVVEPGAAAVPPRQLNPDEIAERAGDRHGSAEDHRREFPDGRVGAHSALARPEDGERLLNLAAMLVAEDYREILGEP